MKFFWKRSLPAWELKKLAEEKQGKPLKITDDVVFKIMLSQDNEDSRGALISLLSACTRREVSKVRLLNSELLPVYHGGKLARLDVLVTFNDGETANLEMQSGVSDDDLKKRAEFYASEMVAGQLKKGKKYVEIKRVYQIFFLNCKLFGDSEKLPRRYSYREETEHDRLGETSEIIFYELPKLERRFKDIQSGKTDLNDLTDEEKWCMFMKYRHEEKAVSLIDQICREKEGIMKAENTVVKISRDYIKYVREITERRNRYDAYEAGEKEGMEKGEQSIINLLKSGKSPEEIIAEYDAK
jgi:predicted transposase/invertase (TIGR01784 family)